MRMMMTVSRYPWNEPLYGIIVARPLDGVLNVQRRSAMSAYVDLAATNA